MAVKQQIPSSTNAPKTLNFAKLRGVDFSTSPFEVASTRATDMKNLINEDGVNHKRPGWSENNKISEIIANTYGSEKVLAVTKAQKHTVIVMPTRILVFYNNVLKVTKDILNKTITNADFVIRKSEVIIYCYLIDGITETYVLNLSTLEINIADPYIPTTTVSINPISSETSTRGSLDFANILTTKITNSLVANKETEFSKLYVTIDYSALPNILFENVELKFYFSKTGGTNGEEINDVEIKLEKKTSSFVYNSAIDDVYIRVGIYPSTPRTKIQILNEMNEEVYSADSYVYGFHFKNTISENSKLKVILSNGGDL